MSDTKPPPDDSPPEEGSPDQSPLDHVPPDEPPPDHVSPDSGDEPQIRDGRVVEHLLSRTAWLRVLFMVLFVALWGISRFVIVAVMVVQVLFLLFGGKRNARLAAFGQNLAAYSYELVAYLTFASEDQPFPFSDWPGSAAPSDRSESD